MKIIFFLILSLISASSYAAAQAKCPVNSQVLPLSGPNISYVYPKTMPLTSASYVIRNTCASSSGAAPVYVYLDPDVKQYSGTSLVTIPGGAAPEYIREGTEFWEYYSLSINGTSFTNLPSLDPQLVYTTDTATPTLTITNQWSISTKDSTSRSDGAYHIILCGSKTSNFTDNCTTTKYQWNTGGYVIANCEINGGNATVVDFGTIQSKAFLTAGAPITSARKNVQIPIVCTGVSASTIAAQFVANGDPTNEDIATTSTDGVDVIFTNSQGTTIPVNSGTTPIPISNSKGTLEFNVTPVGTTGKAPAAGKFTSLITIYLDIP